LPIVLLQNTSGEQSPLFVRHSLMSEGSSSTAERNPDATTTNLTQTLEGAETREASRAVAAGAQTERVGALHAGVAAAVGKVALIDI
jgi:hypothetical protein